MSHDIVKMAASSVVTIFLVLFVNIIYLTEGQIEWPVPYYRFQSRPKFNSYCQPGAIDPFCPTGEVPNHMPRFHDDDMVEVYALKAPVFEFKFGDLLGKFHIMHDAMAFNNLNTRRNYTLEWYELVELFNCTFAHVLKNDTMLWCNQGAACVYDGVDDNHWIQNGTLVKVADITGKMYNEFAEWVLWDNSTAIYYETWTVEQEPGGKMWFDSFDCASFVLRAFEELAKLGTKFDQSVRLNYTRIHLYCDEPIYLGNQSEIMANETLANEILDFYKKFQSHQSYKDLLTHMIAAFEEVFDENLFYFFYNFEYWLLPMKAPHIKLTYYEVPLPKPKVKPNHALTYEKHYNP